MCYKVFIKLFYKISLGVTSDSIIDLVSCLFSHYVFSFGFDFGILNERVMFLFPLLKLSVDQPTLSIKQGACFCYPPHMKHADPLRPAEIVMLLDCHVLILNLLPSWPEEMI